MIRPPPPNSNGSYFGILKNAPELWPWALPHYFAVNVASHPGEKIVSANATPTGEVQLETKSDSHIYGVETIAYWREQFAMSNITLVGSKEKSLRKAKHIFHMGRTRLLLTGGKQIAENAQVNVTGEWSGIPSVKSVNDMGWFFSYLYDYLIANQHLSVASQLRKSIYRAWPINEMVLMYIDVLDWSQKNISQHLDWKHRLALRKAKRKARNWLK